MTLDELRGELAAIDREILRLVARRLEVAAGVGATKARDARPIRDPAQERAVLRRAGREARALGLPRGLAAALMRRLLDAALAVQEQGRMHAQATGRGRRALVIGGAGRMGWWFVRFLRTQQWTVEIADPAGPPHRPEVIRHADWRTLSLDHDLIVVAAPLRTSGTILSGLAARRPRGVVCDIGSLKAPLRNGLDQLAKAGVQVASIHPMFGPDARLLRGRCVILVDLGSETATRLMEALFAPTLALVVRMDLAEHDRMAGFTLGLPHALNLAFLAGLKESGVTVCDLRRIAGTTFVRQLGVARRVASESPHLSFDIQWLNDYGTTALDALNTALKQLRSAVRRGKEGTFVTLMEEGRAFLRARRPSDRPAPERQSDGNRCRGYRSGESHVPASDSRFRHRARGSP